MSRRTKTSRIGATLLALSVALLSCTPAALPTPTASPTPAPTPTPAVTNSWWRNVVFYELFVRSFYDSNGDGVGDLAGVTEKLDYLNDGAPETSNDLEVGALWLMPVMEAHSYHGYDVIDYETIEPDYGDMAAMQGLLNQAHARGMHVIVDLVVNHTSSYNPWFESASTGPESPYRGWYIWADSNPGYVGPSGQQVWYPLDNSFYYAIFSEEMPDLNYRDAAVTQAMDAIARFWLEEVGVDGFRLDAAQYIIEDGQDQANTPETHAWLARFNDGVHTASPTAMTVGEVWASTGLVVPYVTDHDIDLAFEFDLAGAIISSVQSGDPGWLAYMLDQVVAAYPQQAYAPFLTNHDQNRVMSQLRRDKTKAQLAASILLTIPGVPFMYYGEEIGMVGSKPDERIRTPMQWDGAANAGFTTGDPWEPVNDDFETVNVAAQTGDPGSLLAHYRQLIRLRNRHPALTLGTYDAVKSSCIPVLAFLRHAGEESLLVLANLADGEQGGCTFNLTAGPLARGAYAGHGLLARTQLSGPQVTDGGGFAGYDPGLVLAAGQVAVIALVPAP